MTVIEDEEVAILSSTAVAVIRFSPFIRLITDEKFPEASEVTMMSSLSVMMATFDNGFVDPLRVI